MPTYTYYGTGSYFCCGNAWGPCAPAGGGSCGDCQSSQFHCAWPKVKRPGYPDCDLSGCGWSLQWRYCGDPIDVLNRCNSLSVRVYVKDCGPHQAIYCNTNVACGSCGSFCSAIIDLSPRAFSSIADLDLGRIPVRVSFTV